LNGGPIHEKVMNYIDKFIEKGQSIEMVLHKELYQFEAVWDIDRYESDSDEDEMYDNDSSKMTKIYKRIYYLCL
jgi:hypothetical protein